MNKNLVEIIEKESMFEEERQNGIKWLEARFIVGQSYGVTDNNLKSNGVEIAFTVNKNTHKSLNITIYEKYNGVVTVTENVRKMLYPGSHGIWRKFEGVKYAGIECFDVSAKFSRWTKGTLFVFNTKEVNLDDFTSCDNVAKTENKEKTTKALNCQPAFYEIDENMIELANSLNSFNTYNKGSITAMYKNEVEEVFKSIENSEDKERSLYIANLFAKKYAQYLNDYYRNEASCPSVLVAGPARFPAKKKENALAAAKACTGTLRKPTARTKRPVITITARTQLHRLVMSVLSG